MTDKININPFLLAFLGAFSLGTFALMMHGFYYQDWRGGFGLVMFVTSLVSGFSIILAPIHGHESEKEELQNRKAA